MIGLVTSAMMGRAPGKISSDNGLPIVDIKITYTPQL